MSSSSASASALRKRSSCSPEPVGRKIVLKDRPAVLARTGGVALSSVEAILDGFQQKPYMISSAYLDELRAMADAWARVDQRCIAFQNTQSALEEQRAANRDAVHELKGPLTGVICQEHFYLAGSNAILGTPFSRELWELILSKLAHADRASFSTASKGCLRLQRGMIVSLKFGHCLPRGGKYLMAARKETIERCGRAASYELDQLLVTPRCVEIFIDQPVTIIQKPVRLPEWYYSEVVEMALRRCTQKVTLIFTQITGPKQCDFLALLYRSPIQGGAAALKRVRRMVVRTRPDLLKVLKAMGDGIDGDFAPEASLWPPILFDGIQCLGGRDVDERFNECEIFKSSWSFDLETTSRMRKFSGIFVHSAAAFEQCFRPAPSGTLISASNRQEFSPLFTAVFPVYIDPRASASNPSEWSRAVRYQPAYFKPGEAEGLFDLMASEHKKLTF